MLKSNRNFVRPRSRTFSILVLLTCTIVLFVGTGYAQVSGYGTINGTVTDITKAVISDANVIITNIDNGAKREAVTGSSGDYSAPYLPPGRYTITVSRAGFKTATQPSVTLTVSQVATVNISLEVGQTQETVQVTTNPEMIETTSVALGDLINNTSVQELPLNTRNPAEFANLAAGGVNGAARTSAITLAGNGSGIPGEAGTSIDGSRMGGVYYQLDGIYNMDNYLSSGNPFPNADATQEFRVLTNNFSAEYGGGSTAVVSVVTKSGTNEWHGNAFEFARNEFFNAKNWFSATKDGYKRNIFGGSEGGPLQRNKQFIFGNLQLTKSTLAQNGSATYVPTDAMLNNGDFSGAIPSPLGSGCPNAASNGIQLHDFDGTPFPCNVIPNWSSSKVNAVSQNIEKHLPQTTNPSGLVYAPGAPITDTTKEFTIKYDWNLGPKDQIMGRVFFDDFNRPAIANDSNWAACGNSWIARNQNYAANWTHTFSPTLVNSFSFGYDRLNSATLSCINQSWKDLGANIFQPDKNATILVSWGSTGFSWIDQNVTQKRHDFDIADQVSWSKGKNLIVAGVNVMTEYSLEQASWLADPLVNFNGSVTGAFFSDFLLGDIGNFEQGGGEYNVYSSPEIVAYVQDTIKLKPNLTLSLGVRYEPWKAMEPTPKGREANWWPGHQSTVYPNAPEGLVFPGDAGVPCCGYKSDFNRWAPRLGITWQPSFWSNTSIRAAAGRFPVPYYTSFYNHVSSDPPFSPTYQLTPQSLGGVRIPFEDPWSVFEPTGGANPFVEAGFAYRNGAMPGKDATFITPVALPAIFPPSWKLGWSQNWNLSIEHGFASNFLVTAAYVGSEAYHITTGADVNPGIYTQGCLTTNSCGVRSLFPDYQSVLVYLPLGTASYNGLHLSADKRLSHGLQFVSNFSWSKALDLLSQSDLSSGPTLRDAFNPGIDRGISNLDVKYVWSNRGTWALPAFKGHGPLAAGALGNWELSAIYTTQAGVPFGVSGGANGSNNSYSQNGNDLADRTTAPLNVKQGSKTQWLNSYFNPAAFVPNAVGTHGNSGRNMLRGPRGTNLDLAFLKNFPFYNDQYRLQLRWEMYNATNTPWFGLPDTNPTDTNYTKITGTQNGPRVMQFAAKFLW